MRAEGSRSSATAGRTAILPSPARLSRCIRSDTCPSKLQPQDQLNLTCGFIERRNRRKTRCDTLPPEQRYSKIGLIDERLRVIEIGVIEEIERIGPKGEPACFSQPAQRE